MSKKAIAALIAAALVLVGGLLFGGVMTALHWDFTRLSTTKYETNEYTLNEDFENLTIITDTADIVLVPSEGTDGTVMCYEQEYAPHRVAVKDGTLTIEVMNTKKWYDYIGIRFGTPKITLSVPPRAYGALAVQTSTGDVEIPKEFSFDRIAVTGSTGDVTNAACATEAIDIAVNTGDIQVKTVTANRMNLSVSTGKVTVTDVSCAQDMTVRVSTGKTFLTAVRCQNLISDGNTGDLFLKNVVAIKTLSLHRSTGDVHLDGCDATDILIETDTGDVTGSLLTDKLFITRTDTGRVEVPKTTAGDPCRITTDTGDINIQIQP